MPGIPPIPIAPQNTKSKSPATKIAMFGNLNPTARLAAKQEAVPTQKSHCSQSSPPDFAAAQYLLLVRLPPHSNSPPTTPLPELAPSTPGQSSFPLASVLCI